MTYTGNFFCRCMLWLLLVPAVADTTMPEPGAPQGLMVELLRWPEDTVIRQAMPRFTWIVNDAHRGACQSDDMGPAWSLRPVVRSAAMPHGRRPQPGPLDRLDAKVPTIRGPVHVSWRRLDQEAELQVVIPANTTADIHLPTQHAAAVTEQGRLLQDVSDIAVMGQQQNCLVVEVQAGSYQFRFPYQ